jgi:hypothetical protein
MRLRSTSIWPRKSRENSTPLESDSCFLFFRSSLTNAIPKQRGRRFGFCFLFRHDPSFGKKLLFLIFAPIIGYLFYLVVYTGPPFLLLLFSKKTRSDNREISKLEKAYFKSSRRLIIKRFGLLAYFKFFGGINKGLNSGYEYCTNHLQHKKAESDDNLRFNHSMALTERQ